MSPRKTREFCIVTIKQITVNGNHSSIDEDFLWIFQFVDHQHRMKLISVPMKIHTKWLK